MLARALSLHARQTVQLLELDPFLCGIPRPLLHLIANYEVPPYLRLGPPPRLIHQSMRQTVLNLRRPCIACGKMALPYRLSTSGSWCNGQSWCNEEPCLTNRLQFTTTHDTLFMAATQTLKIEQKQFAEWFNQHRGEARATISFSCNHVTRTRWTELNLVRWAPRFTVHSLQWHPTLSLM